MAVNFMSPDRLHSDLDDDQFAAVTAPLGDALCIANAGAGKTRVLTYRVALFLAQNVPASSICMLTFTRKAAEEMRDRICKLLGVDTVDIVSGTFHSVACRYLRRYGYWPKGVMVADESESDAIMSDVCKRMLITEDACDSEFARKRFPSAKEIKKAYSFCRNTGTSLQSYFVEDPEWSDFSDRYEATFGRDSLDRMHIYVMNCVDAYTNSLQQQNLKDFDDILVDFNHMLDDDFLRERIVSRVFHIFVDEYQDINYLQYEIVKKLRGDNPDGSLTVVGDDAQCIYGFRGSDVRFIRHFHETYPDSDRYLIRNNYRSDNKIVSLAECVINGVDPDCKKEMSPVRMNNTPIVARECKTDDDQAAYILHEIQVAHERGIKYSDMAILVRIGHMGSRIDRVLSTNGIPVEVDAGVTFYQRANVQIATSYLKLLLNPRNKAAWRKVFTTLPGVADRTAYKLYDVFAKNGYDLRQLSDLTDLVPAKGRARFADLAGAFSVSCDVLDGKLDLAYDSVPHMCLNVFVKQYFYEYLRAKDAELAECSDGQFETYVLDENIIYLLEVLSAYDSLDTYLDDMLLSVNESVRSDEGCVKITTIHKSKGLEWKKVFLAYAGDSVMMNKVVTKEEVQEAGRVLYVALTRATDELDILSVRYTNGHREPDRWCRLLRPYLGQFCVSSRLSGGSSYHDYI